MTGRILCVTDMHLMPGADAGRDARLAALLDTARDVDGLYCLGDTFNYWYEKGHHALDGYRPLCDMFRAAVARGVRLFFLRGNRDSFAGRELERRTGGVILPEVHLLSFGGRRILLTHGDMFDRASWWFDVARRHFFYGWAGELLRWTLPWAAERRITEPIAAGRRHIERAELPFSKSRLDDARVCAAVREHAADWVICGHFHTGDDAQLAVDGRPVRRFVLPPWFRAGACLDISETSVQSHGGAGGM